MSVVRGCESSLLAILSIRMGQEYKPKALFEEGLISVSFSLWRTGVRTRDEANRSFGRYLGK